MDLLSKQDLGKTVKDIPQTTLQPSVKLKQLKIILAKKFDNLSIHQTTSRHGVPFLHVWKPISRSEGVQGMEFLPCFHIIITLMNGNDNSQSEASSLTRMNDSYLFQLHSFHGKVLAEELHFFNQCDNSTKFDLVTRMANDTLQFCHGVNEIDEHKLSRFINSCDLPLLNMFKSIFLIEQLMGTVLVRSRLCKFVLYTNNTMTYDDYNEFNSCEECNLFRSRGKDQSDRIDAGIKVATQNGDIVDNMNIDDNVFHQVFSKTSIFDMQALAMIKKVDEFRNDSKFNEFERAEIRTHGVAVSQKYSEQSSTQIKLEGKLNCNDLTSTNEKSETGTNPHLQFMPDLNPLIDAKYIDNTTLGFNGEQGSCDTLCLDPSLVEDDCTNGDTSYMENTTAFGNDNAFEPDQLSNFCDSEFQISLSTNEKRKARTKRKLKADKSNSDIVGKPKKLKLLIPKHKTPQKDKEDIRDGKKEFRRTCMICLYEFQSECNFNTDQLRHQQAFGDMEQPVSCPLCRERIETKYMVSTHFEEKHSSENVTCCCECLEVIPKGSNRLRRHILKIHHSATEKQVCPECGQECAGNAKLEIHMAETHSDKKAAVCEECGKSFGHLKVYKQHLRRHHNPRDLQCLQCDKKFEHRQQAIDHLVVHTGIKPYKCVQCNYVSYRISNVICIHFMKCHGRKGISATDLTTDIVERDRMMEIARAGVQEMVKIRDLKVKKEFDA